MMLFLNLSILRNKKLLLNQAKSIPWFHVMIGGQVIGILAYALTAIIALYHSRIAILLTFLMLVYWTFATKDIEEDFAD